MSIETYKALVIICNEANCKLVFWCNGKTAKRVRELAKENGWSHSEVTRVDHCPEHAF